MKVDIVEPYGFCIGVSNAIAKLIDLSSNSNKQITVVNQLVHNKYVMDSIKEKGIKVICGNKEEVLDQIDSGIVVFSAHGTDEKIKEKAKQKGVEVIDLVCPYVLKEFTIIQKKISEGYDIVYIGINNHEESDAARSISKEIHFVETIADIEKLEIKNDKIAIVNQTTLSIKEIDSIYKEILKKYPSSLIIDEICDSTRLRQENTIKLAGNYKAVIVVGDSNSNNANSLLKAVKSINKNAFLIDGINNLDLNVLNGIESVLICSSASTSKEVVLEVAKMIKNKK